MDQDTPASRPPRARTLPRRGWRFGVALLFLAALVAEVVARALLPPPGMQASGLVMGYQPGAPHLRYDPALGGWIRARQELTPFLFVPDDKPAGVLRIAALGDGTLRTVPPDGPAWQLAALLEHGSGREVQLIAAAGRGYGTARLEGLQRELLGHDLDAVVLYTGHYEFAETRSSPLLDLRRPPLLRAIQVLASRSRLLAVLGVGVHTPPPPPPGNHGALAQDPLEIKERARLLDWFRARLEAMADDVCSARVPAVWVLPASNLLRPPRSSAWPEGASSEERGAFERDVTGLGEAVERGDPGVIAALQPVLERAPAHAGLWYLRGRALLAAGDVVGAREALTRARDLDASPCRATSDQRRAMDEVARAHGIAVVDAEAALLAADQGRYLHGGYGNHYDLLTTEAYRIVMEAVYGELVVQFSDLGDPMALRAALPARDAPLPSLRAAPAMRGPVFDSDFRIASAEPAGPDPVPPP